MVTDYFVCYGPSTDKLREAVNIAIQKGWQPLGGVSAAISIKWLDGQYGCVAEEVRECLYQAVVKTTHDQK